MSSGSYLIITPSFTENIYIIPHIFTQGFVYHWCGYIISFSIHPNSSAWLRWNWGNRMIAPLAFDATLGNMSKSIRFEKQNKKNAGESRVYRWECSVQRHYMANHCFVSWQYTGPKSRLLRRPTSWGIMRLKRLNHDDVIKWEYFACYWVLCEGNPPATAGFLSQRPVTQSLDVFYNLRLNKRLSKQSRCWWFETSSRPLWRHCNSFFILFQKNFVMYVSSGHSFHIKWYGMLSIPVFVSPGFMEYW